MKKLLLIPLFFLGCASINVEKNIKETSIEKKLIDNYQITKDALTKIDNNYYFTTPDANGLAIYKLDKNYNLTQKKVIKKLIEAKKLLSFNNKIYIIGYDQEKNKPIILTLDKNLNVISQNYFANKFDIPKDAVFDKNLVVLLLTYKNGADIEIYNKKLIVFKQKNNQLPSFIKKFQKGYIIVGTYQKPQSEDLLILYVKNNKIVWEKIYDFGMDDVPKKVEIKNDKIKINLISQDYMGAEKYIEIELDKNGNIIKHEKNLEFKQLPTRFRT